MIKFINSMGGFMYVDDSRVEEYKEAGYRLASDAPKPVKKSTTRKAKEKKED